jgi:DNA topoisomerase-1
MTTIQDRGYVEREGRQLKPTELGMLVNDFLFEHFPDIVNLGFTAEMEEDLDEVATGSRPWQPMVREFYNPLAEALGVAGEAEKIVQETGNHCPECERPLIYKFGRFGKFIACSGFPECRYTKQEGEPDVPEKTDEKCDVCGAEMVVKRGRFGAFYACTKYPDCKGTKPMLLKTGILCPIDGGEIVERMTRQKRRFYGCANYPNCDFTTWQKPLPGLCPVDRGLLTSFRNQARCASCGWQGAPEEALEIEKGIAGTPPPKREESTEDGEKPAAKGRAKAPAKARTTRTRTSAGT